MCGENKDLALKIFILFLVDFFFFFVDLHIKGNIFYIGPVLTRIFFEIDSILREQVFVHITSSCDVDRWWMLLLKKVSFLWENFNWCEAIVFNHGLMVLIAWGHIYVFISFLTMSHTLIHFGHHYLIYVRCDLNYNNGVQEELGFALKIIKCTLVVCNIQRIKSKKQGYSTNNKIV